MFFHAVTTESSAQHPKQCVTPTKAGHLGESAISQEETASACGRVGEVARDQCSHPHKAMAGTH